MGMGRKRFDELRWWQQAALLLIGIPLVPVVTVIGLVVVLPCYMLAAVVCEAWDDFIAD